MQDLIRRNTISDSDTADNFAFTLDENSSLDISLHELDRETGDVNIRVVRDLNSNGLVDKNEIVARGASTSRKDIDSILNLSGTGDYILQVCQSKGSNQFEVNFDHVAI